MLWRTSVIVLSLSMYLMFDIVRCLTIDNQLQIVRSDCFERLAIGQRLDKNDVYRTTESKVVPDCQKECTHDDDKCRSFSFGIGLKGNATCELSSHVVKETTDLKPIGTIADTDFDLYIKKLGCKIVQENKPNPHILQDEVASISGYSTASEQYTEEHHLTLRTPQGVYGSPPGGYGSSQGVYGSPQGAYDSPKGNYGSPQGPYDSPKGAYGPLQGTYDPPKGAYDSPQGAYDPPNAPYGSPQGAYDPPKGVYGSPQGGYDSPQGVYGSPQDASQYSPKPSYDGDKTHNVQSMVSVGPVGANRRPSYHYETSGNYASSHSQMEVHQGGSLTNSPYDSPYSPPRPGSDYGSSGPYDRPYGADRDRPRPSLPTSPYDSPSRPSQADQFDSPYSGPSRPRPSIPNSLGRPDYQSDAPYERPGPLNRPSLPNSVYEAPGRPGGDQFGSSYGTPGSSHRPYDSPGGYGGPPNKPVHEEHDESRPPFRPSHLNRPYDGMQIDRPGNDYGGGSNRPDYRPHGPPRPNDPDSPDYGPGDARPGAYDYGNPPKPTFADFVKPAADFGGYDSKPLATYDNRPEYTYGRPGGLYGSEMNKLSLGAGANRIPGVYSPKYPYQKPVITESIGPNGQIITSIITEISNACFRRALAGKRVLRNFVRRALPCERVEDCQQECADEKHFVCEGFNFRIDTSARGKGDCELLDIPFVLVDIQRDVLPDPDWDYYEKDRNASPDCKHLRPISFRPSAGEPAYRPSGGGAYQPSGGGAYQPSGGGAYQPYGGGSFRPSGAGAYRPSGGGSYLPNSGNTSPYNIGRPPLRDRPSYGGDRLPYGGGRPALDTYAESHHGSAYDRIDTFSQHGALDRHGERYDYRGQGDRRGSYGDRLPPSGDDRYDRHRPYNRRGDFYGQTNNWQDHYDSKYYRYQLSNENDYNYQYTSSQHPPTIPYVPAYTYKPPYDYKSYEPYSPTYRRDGYDSTARYDGKYYQQRESDRNYWGLDKHDRGWGSYGGTYGNFGMPYNAGHYDSYNLNRNNNRYDSSFYGRNYDYPQPIGGTNDWGKYGGTYGTGGYDYWSLSKRKQNRYDDYSFNQVSYLPAPSGGGGYDYHGPEYPSVQDPPYPPARRPVPPYTNALEPRYPSAPVPAYPSVQGTPHPSSPGIPFPSTQGPPYSTSQGPPYPSSQVPLYPSAVGPPYPSTDGPVYRPGYNYLEDECSLRSVTGFRLYKGIVKKVFSTPTIFDCELLCFQEKDFACNSYAFRYTTALLAPNDNCYLSERNYKELDYYTDLEQDRNFDIYTMNNRKQCDEPSHRRDYSDCFWHIRSGQRLAQSCVKDSLNVKSVDECQSVCLRSNRFTCRAFSFRYGSPIIGGIIDNCQLTDVPFHELDPRIDLVAEPGFELYKRGSFGYGCEPDFMLKQQPKQGGLSKIDQICYVGFGSPAKLLPDATRKALLVDTESDCKSECTRLREETNFCCVSFSYKSLPHTSPNCFLSDIFQRDLLENVDYTRDADSWLFAWDNYNPQCYSLSQDGYPSHNDLEKDGLPHPIKPPLDIFRDLNTWRVYSVGGWPCRRGTLCKQNREVGFWYCELEGGSPSNWDYCCRPDHQCGYSERYPYQWCYVGPSSTQWRKCSDRYYPYMHSTIDRHDRPHVKPYLPDDRPHTTSTTTHLAPLDFHYLPEYSTTHTSYVPEKTASPSGHREPRPWITTGKPSSTTLLNELQAPYRPSFRPDRPHAPPTIPPPKPSLDTYEMEFDNQFLDPPRPGGFGQPRHWPVLYLHKEMPPNLTTPFEQRYERVEMGKGDQEERKFEAIKSLINVIKSNDLNNIQYQIANQSNKADDVLYVQIPLPTNFTENASASDVDVRLSKPVDLLTLKENATAKSEKKSQIDPITAQNNAKLSNNVNRSAPVYRRSYVTRTNITNYGRRRPSGLIHEFT